MNPPMTLHVYDPYQKKLVEEKIFGKKALKFLYQDNFIGKCIRLLSLGLITRWPLTSYLYGAIQKGASSKNKIAPFIQNFEIDPTEFQKKVDEFTSFNDFFIRKLKKSARPIDPSPDTLVMPADGRYLVFENFEARDTIFVKGKTFSLEKLIGKKELPWKGPSTVVVIRLCPTDYHRYHFPADGVPMAPQAISGALFSVSPLALKINTGYLTENKRVVTEFASEKFGKVLLVEIGATHVGSIRQTFTPNKFVKKGDEKGFFEFGGSCLVLALEKKQYQINPQLLEYSDHGIETLGHLGQPLLKL